MEKMGEKSEDENVRYLYSVKSYFFSRLLLSWCPSSITSLHHQRERERERVC